MPLFAPGFEGEILDLTVTLSQVLFPILILLGISGVVVGILNSYDRFGAFAIAPLFWNLTIILLLVVLVPMFEGQDRIYAYAIGILAGTLVQLLIPVFDLRNTPFKFGWSFDWRNPDVRRVLLLMLPVTISLGLINFNLLINSLFGTPGQRPGAGGDRQGVPHLPAAAGDLLGGDRDRPLPDPGPLRLARRARQPAGDDGQRDAPDPLRPGAGRRRRPRPLRADDPARLPARRVHPRADDRWSRRHSSGSPSRCRPTASSCSLTRTFFSLQRPWLPTAIAAGNLAVTALAALGLYHLGVGGIVAATAIATGASVVAQGVILRRLLGGLELGRLLDAGVRIALASAALAAVSFGVWDVLDNALGRGLVGQIVSLGVALGVGGLVYVGGREAAAHRRAGADHAPGPPPLDARAWALPAGSRRARPARRLRLAGRSALARSAAAGLHGRPGASRHRRRRAGAPDLGRRAARQLRPVRAGAVSRAVGCRVAVWSSRRVAWGRGGPSDAAAFFAATALAACPATTRTRAAGTPPSLSPPDCAGDRGGRRRQVRGWR